jgi:hypothetical protein
MSANTQLLTACLLARVFAFAAAVTVLLALVDATLQSATADFTTADFGEPTRLVLDDVFATQA